MLEDQAKHLQYQAAVSITFSDTDVIGRLSFRAGQLSEAQSVNVCSAFNTALWSIIQQPQNHCRNISLVSSRAVEQLYRWNVSQPRMRATYNDILRQHVLSQPHAIAIQTADKAISYQVMYAMSSRLCGALIQAGVQPQDVVSLCFEKSALPILAMLAVLKAGATFACLDPTYPDDRLRWIVSTCGATLLLSSTENYSRWNALSNLKVIALNEDSFTEWELPPAYPEALPHAAAYVIFTSGSTGEPKGMVTEHGALVTSVLSHGKLMEVSNTSRILQNASFAFDVSILEIMTTLAHGGCVCVPRQADRLGHLPTIMAEFKANWAFMTPSVLSLYRPSDFPFLKTLICGGENIPEGLLDPWSSQKRVFTAYGPAECCIAQPQPQLRV